MEKLVIIKKTEAYVRGCMEEAEPGHDYLHVKRVRKTANRIASTLNADLFLLDMLSLLHDIEDHKFESSHKVKDFLDSLDIEEGYKDKILFVLPYLSFSKYPVLSSDFPIEGKIVADADRIDAMGAIGVARAFSYGGNKNRRMYGEDNSTIKHFDEKLLVLDRYLNLEESRDIAKKRMEYLKGFYEEFLTEVNDG